jgi:hypothetical protein
LEGKALEGNAESSKALAEIPRDDTLSNFVLGLTIGSLCLPVVLVIHLL